MKSNVVKIGMQQILHRSLFNAFGMTEEEMRKPLVGIVSFYDEIIPGHMNLNKIVDAVKLGVAMAGGALVVFPVIAVCDGIVMGHIGMKYFLVTKDSTADPTECMAPVHRFGALVVVPSCSENVPGLLMAATRINVPTVSISGGPVLADHVRGYETSPSSMFEAVGAYVADNMSEEDVKEFEDKICSTRSSCSGMYTANSMNYLTEVLDMGLRGNGTIPAAYSRHIKLVKHVDMEAVEMYEKNICPGGTMTKEAFMNALTIDMALGCSTNSIFHLPVTTHETGVELSADITNEISARAPNLCYPVSTGPAYMEDLNKARGVYAVMKEINRKGPLNLDYMTATGRTVGENIKDCINKNPEVIRPVENPYSQAGGIAILKGNLAPNSAVMKRFAAAPEMLKHEGLIRVFDCEEDATDATKGGRIMAGDMVVIRYEGSKGGPGMREMLNPASVIVGMELGFMVALIADGCFFDVSRGASIGHTSSEVIVGGPITLVEEGDIISIDIDNHKLNTLIFDEEMVARKARWQPYTSQVITGYPARYAFLVASVERGAVQQVKQAPGPADIAGSFSSNGKGRAP